MECQSSPRNSSRDADGRESSSSVLRCFTDGMPALAFGFVLTVVSPCITFESGRLMIKNASAASGQLIQMDIFAFSMVVAFASALSAITFRPSLPAIAHVLEDLSVVFLALAFASLVSVLIREQLQCFAYVLCMIPAIPLLRRICQPLFSCLVALIGIVAGWFDGGEAPVQTEDGCTSV